MVLKRCFWLVCCFCSLYAHADSLQSPFPQLQNSSKENSCAKTRLYNIGLMNQVLKKDEYNGYDIIIISSTTEEEAEYQQCMLENMFKGTSKSNGKTPVILSVVDLCEGGQIIGMIFTWFKAEEKMRNKHPELLSGYNDLMDFVKKTEQKVAVFHNGGKGERFSPLTQSLGNSRGAQKLVGSIVNAIDEEIELEVLMSVVLQCSSFAKTNPGTHIDTYWTSQIAFGSEPHDALKRSNFCIDKFLVEFDKNVLIPANIADSGTSALSESGRMMAFYGNKRFSFRKGNNYQIDQDKIDSELFSKGDRFAYDFGSFSCTFDFFGLLIDYWKGKNVFCKDISLQTRTKIKRDIDPHFIQPLIRVLYAINDLAQKAELNEKLSSPEFPSVQTDLDSALQAFNDVVKKNNSDALVYIWGEIENEKDAKKKVEAITCMNEAIEFYLLYRNSLSFSDLTKIFGYIDLGKETQWFRFRRPIDIMNEKFEMLTDMIGHKIEVQLNGDVKESHADENLMSRCREARLMRGIQDDKIVNFTVEGKAVALSISEVKEGRHVEGVYVKNSIIQKSDLTKGSRVIDSVVNHVCGKVIAYRSYLESSTCPTIIANVSVVHKVGDIRELHSEREVVSDVYRTKVKPMSYHGRMRAPIGYDPKGMPIYKVIGKNENGKPIFSDTYDEAIQYFIEKVPYALHGVGDYSDETARTDDGLYTFEEIRRIDPNGIEDKAFCCRIRRIVEKFILQSR